MSDETYFIGQFISMIAYTIFAFLFIYRNKNIQGSIRTTLLIYILPLSLRWILSVIMMNGSNLYYLFGIQMIVFKLCLYILLSTLFKMKKIEIEISCGENLEIINNLRIFLLNTRIFLIFYAVDIMA